MALIPVQPKFPNSLTFSSDLLHNKIRHMSKTLLISFGKIENEVSQMINVCNTFLVTVDVSSLYSLLSLSIDQAEMYAYNNLKN